MIGTLLAAAILVQNHKSSCCATMADFANDPAFLALHLPPETINYEPKSGHMVHWKIRGGADAYAFYVPPAKGNSAAVVMVHEFWGLNDQIKRQAEILNGSEGYAVLAVDLYDRKVTKDAKEAGKLMQSNNADRSKAIVGSAVAALKGGRFGPKASKIGSVGYCFGGGWSFQTAVQGRKNVDACVIYYGMPDTSPEALAKLHAPVLMFHAKQDQWINDEVVGNFKKAMEGVHKPLEVVDYDANHAFANPSNPRYNKVAAEDAWKRTLAFFKEHLN
jgi:carboxymethylenebutenolidase